MLNELLTATNLLHVYIQPSGPRDVIKCRYCPRTYADFRAYDSGRGTKICAYVGDYTRLSVMDMANWIPRSLIKSLLETHRRLESELKIRAYASSAGSDWTRLTAELRMRLTDAFQGRALGQSPPPDLNQPGGSSRPITGQTVSDMVAAVRGQGTAEPVRTPEPRVVRKRRVDL